MKVERFVAGNSALLLIDHQIGTKQLFTLPFTDVFPARGAGIA